MKSLLLVISPLLLASCSTLSPKQQVKQEVSEAKSCDFDRYGQKLNSLLFNDDLAGIKQYVTEGSLNVKTQRGLFCNTVTHEAVDFPEALKYFLDQGAPVDEINSFGNTPLAEAVDSNHYESAKMLLEKGARVNLKHSFDNPLLFLALKGSSERMIDLLMEYEACPLENGFMGKTLEDASPSEHIKNKMIAYKKWFLKVKKSCDPEKAKELKEKEASKSK